MTEEIEPHILKKYEIVEKLGKGAYGIVWKAVDRKLKQVVALKKVLPSNLGLRCVPQCNRCTTYLPRGDVSPVTQRYCFPYPGHENIIRLLNIIKAENNKDLYLVFDYMETGTVSNMQIYMSSSEQAS